MPDEARDGRNVALNLTSVHDVLDCPKKNQAITSHKWLHCKCDTMLPLYIGMVQRTRSGCYCTEPPGMATTPRTSTTAVMHRELPSSL